MPADNEPTEERIVVCGLCEEILPGRYDDEEAAQRAADEHAAGEHPDRDEVVVLPVSPRLADIEGEQGLVDIATGAQARLESGGDGDLPLG